MNNSRSLTRREAVQRMLAAAATVSLLDSKAFGVAGLPTGIGSDPNLHAKVIPWERVLTAPEMRTVTVLADLIIPADEKSPAASAVGVPDFINEWVSAPYAQQQADREIVQAGILWMNKESQRRFRKDFADVADTEQRAICDDICSPGKAKKEYEDGASFFAKMRNLVAGGFYSTPEGWRDIGYVGNVPMVEFPGPPPEVLKHLGLA
jgi:hypothetical protein